MHCTLNFTYPIIWASKNGNLTLIKVMLNYKEFFQCKYQFGETPIYVAARNGHTDIVKTLIPRFPFNINDPDIGGMTPICVAAMNGHTEIVKVLMIRTKNPHAPDNRGLTPIYVANKYGHKKVVKILKSTLKPKPVYATKCKHTEKYFTRSPCIYCARKNTTCDRCVRTVRFGGKK